jgi:hypothetical protein
MELFKSPDHAAMFALRYSSQQYAPSPVAKQMQRVGQVQIGQGKGLVGLDGAAQAGMVRARLDRLNDLERACIIAIFTTRADDCPCCGGTRLTDDYKAALLALAEWAREFIRDEVDSQRMRFGIVQNFFDRKASITKLAKSIGRPARTVLDQKNKIWPHLAKLEKQARAAMGDVLADLCTEDDA